MNTQLSELAKRLVTLSDGRQGLRGTIQTEIREPSSAEPQHSESGIQKPASNTLEFTSSDETLDRYGEIITASGWQLANYQRHPAFQNAHQYGAIIHTLGRALTTGVRSSKLGQTIQFATDVN